MPLVVVACRQTMPGFHAGRPPRDSLGYPADPPTVAEIVAVMRTTGDGPHGRRLRGLIVVLWGAGPGGADPHPRAGTSQRRCDQRSERRRRPPQIGSDPPG
jgi:hypothetical protein